MGEGLGWNGVQTGNGRKIKMAWSTLRITLRCVQGKKNILNKKSISFVMIEEEYSDGIILPKT